MTLDGPLVGVACSVVVVALVILSWVKLVRWAKRGARGAYAMGAVMMLFGMGNIRDPDGQMTYESQKPRAKKGGETGDPPSDEKVESR